MAGSPLTDALGILHSVYPQARVTSGYRDPNSALGRENPRSYHNVGQAFDVAPMAGVKFGDYVNGLKQKGLNVVESLDEASRPAFDTTGPNWHVAFGAPQQGAPPMPYQRPQSRNPYQQGQPDPLAPLPGDQPPMPPQMPPQSLGQMAGGTGQPQMPPQMPQSLGQMAGGPPQAPPQAPPQHHSKFTAGNIMGVLGDALSAYGGKQPTFGPFLREQQMMDKQQGFEREKFQQELAMRMYAMTHPADMMDGIAFANAPKEVQQAMVYRENALHPTVAGVEQPNGSVINKVIPRQLPPQVGEVQDGHRFLGGDPANPHSWQAVQ